MASDRGSVLRGAQDMGRGEGDREARHGSAASPTAARAIVGRSTPLGYGLPSMGSPVLVLLLLRS